MYAQKEKSKENTSRAVANSVSQKKGHVKQGYGFVDNRLESKVLNNLQVKQHCPPPTTQGYNSLGIIQKRAINLLDNKKNILTTITTDNDIAKWHVPFWIRLKRIILSGEGSDTESFLRKAVNDLKKCNDDSLNKSEYAKGEIYRIREILNPIINAYKAKYDFANIAVIPSTVGYKNIVEKTILPDGENLYSSLSSEDILALVSLNQNKKIGSKPSNIFSHITTSAFVGKKDDEGNIKDIVDIKKRESFRDTLGAFLEEARDVEKEKQRYLAKDVFPSNITLYRAIHVVVPESEESFKEALPSSTSWSLDVCKDWAKEPDEYTIFEISAPKNHLMLALSYYRNAEEFNDIVKHVNQDQQEVTLGPSTLSIKGRRQDGEYTIVSANASNLDPETIVFKSGGKVLDQY